MQKLVSTWDLQTMNKQAKNFLTKWKGFRNGLSYSIHQAKGNAITQPQSHPIYSRGGLRQVITKSSLENFCFTAKYMYIKHMHIHTLTTHSPTYLPTHPLPHPPTHPVITDNWLPATSRVYHGIPTPHDSSLWTCARIFVHTYFRVFELLAILRWLSIDI